MKKSRLTLASILFTIVLILWPLLVMFSLPEGSNYVQQFKSISETIHLYILNFMVAFLVAPAMIFMLYEFYIAVSGKKWNFIAKTGFILYGLYFVLVNISYGSQFLYLPFIINSYDTTETLKWYFYNDNSLAIFFNQTGYLVWSIATLTVFIKYLFKSTLIFFIIKILSLSALTQIVATIGLYLNKAELNSLTFYSGILLFPACILIFIVSLNKKT